MAIQILPVIDLLDGSVVRGVGGRRASYRPVESVLCPNASPAVVAAALAASGYGQCYVADLNAIMGGELAAADLLAIAAAGLELWLDAGLGADLPTWPDSLAATLAAIVVAGETAPDRDALARHAAQWGERAVFSLDLKRGIPLGAWSGDSPLAVADAAVHCGFRRMIVLDLAEVGMYSGAGPAELCRQIHQRHPQLELTSGGGIRNRADLTPLADAGCHWALVASALHNGAISGQL